jgi:hypothetical protein
MIQKLDAMVTAQEVRDAVNRLATNGKLSLTPVLGNDGSLSIRLLPSHA